MTTVYPWQMGRIRLALHLGVASMERPLFRHLAGSLDPLDHIRLAADLGFAGITDNNLKLRPPEVQAAMGEALARAGLEMGSITSAPMGTPDAFWGDPDPRFDEGFAQAIETSIAAQRRAGGRQITTCASRADHLPHAVQIATFARRVAAMADRVADAGMALAIEPTSATRTPFFLVHHLHDALTVIGPHPHPGVTLMFDTGHVDEMDGDPAPLFLRHRAAIQTVQIADRNGRVEPGSGPTDFVAMFHVLAESGFAGLVELECYLSRDDADGERAALAALAGIVEAAGQ